MLIFLYFIKLQSNTTISNFILIELYYIIYYLSNNIFVLISDRDYPIITVNYLKLPKLGINEHPRL